MTIPRILIAAPASGSGKTLVTCGILQALVNRGLKVASFKCGPDYIDPMFHSRVIGTKSKNLDSFFCDDETLKFIFGNTAQDCDISVVEGVMGYYDGIGALTTEGSSFEISEKLDIPTVLLVNCKGASISVIPVVQGFLSFRKNNIRGIIFNNMSEKIFGLIAPEIEKMGVKAIGYVPKVSDLVLESRHLGLCMPSEIDELRDKLNRLADVLEKSLNIDLLLKIAKDTPELQYTVPHIPKLFSGIKVGFAEDDVFCFTYEDNVALLERYGAEIVKFSPLNDKCLPDVDCLIFSGGYPELHADRLESNKSMMKDIRTKINNGMPCIAECGGFMYLHDEMEDADGKIHKMCGVISGKTHNAGKLTRFGYATFETGQNGMKIKGHEFHYWDSDNNGSDWTAVKTNGRTYRCTHDNGTLIAGFPHLYYYSSPDFVRLFLEKASEFSSKRIG